MGSLNKAERGILWEREGAIRREQAPLPPRRKSLVVATKPRAGAPRELFGIEEYRHNEGELLNLALNVAPKRWVDANAGSGAVLGEDDVSVSCWAGLYLYAVIAEGRRPKIWIDQATEKLRDLADFLLTQQAGSPTSWTPPFIGATTSTQTEYGAFIKATGDDTSFATAYSEDVAAGGLVLLRAFQLFGDGKYRTGYLAAATCLRRMQQGGKLSTKYASASSGGGRLHTGMWTHRLIFTDPLGAGGGGAMAAPGAATYSITLNTGDDFDADPWPGHSSITVVEDVVYGARYCINLAALPGTEFRVRLSAYIQRQATNPPALTFRVRMASTYETLVSSGTNILEYVYGSQSPMPVVVTGEWVTNPRTAKVLGITGQGSFATASYVYLTECVLTLETR